MAGNKTVILSFSGRRDGNCAQIAKYVRTLTGGEIFSFAELNVRPCGGCNCECFACGSACPHIGDDLRRLYEAVTLSDRAVYILSNHCDYPNANFFAFNERSICFFSGREDLLNAYCAVPKKFIVISGGEQDAFRRALSQHASDPGILFLRAADYGKKSIAGDLMTVPEVARQIESFICEERPVE
jgi:hypothetical protein